VQLKISAREIISFCIMSLLIVGAVFMATIIALMYQSKNLI
jgi:hypothetical protein